MIHFVLAMLSTFLSYFYFGHFSFLLRIQNQNKVIYCTTFDPPCANCCFGLRKPGPSFLTADQSFARSIFEKETWRPVGHKWCSTENGLKNGEVIDTDLSLGSLWTWGTGAMILWSALWSSTVVSSSFWVGRRRRETGEFKIGKIPTFPNISQ